MGANTLRLLVWPTETDHLDFLDKAYNGGSDSLYVIPAFTMTPSKYPDISSAEAREKIKSDFRDMVAIYKHHPAVLTWSIGNELNASYGDKLYDLMTLLEEMAQVAHGEEGDSHRPVIASLADIDLINTIRSFDTTVPSLDMWGANVYRGSSFGSLFADYRTASAKPLLILGYGIDAYDHARHEEDETAQATYIGKLWGEIARNSDTCAGGAVTAYSDEWWKGKYSTDTGCPDNDPGTRSSCGYASAAFPDGYIDEEWWGIMRTVPSNSGPNVMEPRAAYTTLKTIWTQKVLSLASGWNFISLPLQPFDASATSVLSGILDKVYIVWGWDNQNQQWLHFVPGDITRFDLESGKGYWVYMSQPASLSVAGNHGSTTIPLYEGWNLVGYNGGDNKAIASALQAITNRWSLMWGWENGQWNARHAAMSELPVTPLSLLSSGKAYWIKVKTGQAGNWAQ